ncbi:DNA-binding transcriptional MocR family regulator [Bradyrhizobium sp. GM7.3]
MAAHKSDGGTCPLVQRIVVKLFRNGKVDQHIATLSRLLRIHRDVMIEAVRKHLPGTSVCAPNGGYFLWVGLAPEIVPDEFVRRAAKEGVSILSGRQCFAEQSLSVHSCALPTVSACPPRSSKASSAWDVSTPSCNPRAARQPIGLSDHDRLHIALRGRRPSLCWRCAA